MLADATRGGGAMAVNQEATLSEVLDRTVAYVPWLPIAALTHLAVVNLLTSPP